LPDPEVRLKADTTTPFGLHSPARLV